MADKKGLEAQYYADYAHYKEYRDFINDGEQKVSEGLDKAILAVSSSALGLSLAFGKTIWQSFDVNTFLFLKISWVCFGVALLLVVASLLVAGLTYKINRKRCDRILTNRNELLLYYSAPDGKKKPKVIEFEEEDYLNTLNNIFHFLAPVSLAAGIVMIGLFFNENIEGGKQNARSETGQEKHTEEHPSTCPTATSADEETGKT